MSLCWREGGRRGQQGVAVAVRCPVGRGRRKVVKLIPLSVPLMVHLTLNLAYYQKLMIGHYSDPIPLTIELRPALPNRTSVVPKSPGVYAASSPTVNMSPSISGNVTVGSRISSGGVLVKYKRWSASSAPCW
jgi:hypothetical protein